MDFLFGLLNPYPRPPRNSPQSQNQHNQNYRLSVKEALAHHWFSTGYGSISLDNINDLRNGRPVQMMNVTPRPFPRYIQIHGEQLNIYPYNRHITSTNTPPTPSPQPAPQITQPQKLSNYTKTKQLIPFTTEIQTNGTAQANDNMRPQTTNNVISFATNNTSLKQQPEPVMLNPFSKENINNISDIQNYQIGPQTNTSLPYTASQIVEQYQNFCHSFHSSLNYSPLIPSFKELSASCN